MTGADRDRTALAVRGGEALPEFCCDCAGPTRRFVTIRHRTKGEQSAPPAWLMVLAYVTFGLIGPPEGASGRDADEIVIRMPQCESCAARDGPQLLSMNTESLRMTFAVHRAFKQKVAEASQAAASG